MFQGVSEQSGIDKRGVADISENLEESSPAEGISRKRHKISGAVGSKAELSYRPRSQVTAGVYKELLGLLQSILSGESSETLYEAAHEAISIMKADDSERNRRSRLGEFLPRSVVTDEFYSTMVRLSGLITDFVTEEDLKREAEGAAEGIAVTFEEEDEEDGEERFLETRDVDDREAFGKKLLGEEEPTFIEEDVDETVRKRQHSNEIPWSQFSDGFWLRRELIQLGYHESEVASLEQGTIDLLQSNLLNNSIVENKLFQLFKFRNLNLCKLIVHNKFKIWLAANIAASPENREELVAHLLELTDVGAAELYKEISVMGKQMVDEDKLPQPSTLLDLSSLTFEQGGRLMSNPAFTPQTKTFQVSKKGYDEVHVQAPEKVKVKATDLVHVKRALPDWAHPAFAGFETLNPVQSKVFPIAFGEFRENLLMCAPTGAGKTNVAMLTIMNVLSQYWRPDRNNFDLSAFKMVYIAPMKALVQEVVKSFRLRLAPLGLKVNELSGDANLSREQIAETQLIVTTPEKWDVVTRKAGEGRSYTALVRLVIIDEVHLLHDSRGPVLEAIVARTIRQSEQSREFVRIVALSATLPNYKDVALFLRVNLDRGLFHFGSKYRPVPLEQTYIGITATKGLKRAQATNEVVFDKVMEEVGERNNQVLIFVHGRKETVKTAREIKNLAMENPQLLAKLIPSDSASKGILDHEASQVKTNDVRDLLQFGIGIHHAGLPGPDRSVVEDLFAGRHLNIVVCTLTLAWGVNLPAHTVIIKGTQIYMPEKGDWVELSYMDMMQMMGRAGRPQYDTAGHGIVITNRSELQYYLSLNNMQLPIESQLLSLLPDLVNAELALGSVCNRDDVVKWLAYTYLHVRMMRSPSLYGISEDEADADPRLIQRRVDLAHAALTHLDKNGLCKYDRRSGQAQITALGRVSSYFYLRSESVSVYNQHLKPNLTDMDLLRVFSLSREFKYIPVREEEKIELMKLVELVPIPIKGGAEDATSKINVLLQAYISRLSLEGFALMSDMVFVTQNAGRLFRALFEIAIKRGWSVLARRCLHWCKVVELRMWPIQTVLRHFRSIPEEVCRKIERKGLSNEEFSLLSAQDIGEIIRNPRMGSLIHHHMSQLPKMEATAYLQPLTRSTLLVKVDLAADFEYSQEIHGESEYFWVFVEDVSQQHCLFSDQFSVRAQLMKSGSIQTITFTVPVTDPLPPLYFLRIVSDRWMVADTLRPISFKHLVLPAKSLPFTEIADMEPVSISAVAEAQSLPHISELNLVQSQSFACMYQSDDNAVLFAPRSSGKSLCLELAILRARAKVVYVTPKDSLAERKFVEWQKLFGQGRQLRVELLTGEPSQDMKLVERADIVVATPFSWDLISRKWRTKKTKPIMSSIGLFIADNIHLIDLVEGGSLMELVVSRMRYISVNLAGSKMRLIASGSSISNASDIANWIGAPSQAIFSFPPHVRTLPLEIVVHGLDVYNRQTRQAAMLRPLYSNISNGPVVIFATDRKQARLTAADLVLQTSADGQPFRFLPSGGASMITDDQLSMVKEVALRETLRYGVGYIHGGMKQAEREAVIKLYSQGTIQILIVCPELVWDIVSWIKANLVVVLDTSIYSPSEQQYVDYKTGEVNEMLGVAGRIGLDKCGKCVLFCPSSKRELYKRFIAAETLPIESVLDEAMVDYVNTEICNGTIKSRQDCIDWLTWTLFYRRIVANPNYYSLEGSGHEALSNYLSALVEDSVDSLVNSGMIVEEQDDNDSLTPGDLGLVASYYNIRTSTIEKFRRAISATSKRKQLIEILSMADEFSTFSSSSSLTMSDVSFALGLGLEASPVMVLLYAHFNRLVLPPDLERELDWILPIAHRLVLALVDVISTCGWLKVALSAMEIASMLVQAVLPSSSPLLQLPHFDAERCEQAAAAFNVEDVVDVLQMSEPDRISLLHGLSDSQVSDVAVACNAFPSINISIKKEGVDHVHVRLEREGERNASVVAPLFPRPKEEGWWLVLANKATGQIEDLKRITISREIAENIVLNGRDGTAVFLMSDSYIGCDQEEDI